MARILFQVLRKTDRAGILQKLLPWSWNRVGGSQRRCADWMRDAVSGLRNPRVGGVAVVPVGVETSRSSSELDSQNQFGAGSSTHQWSKQRAYNQLPKHRITGQVA